MVSRKENEMPKVVDEQMREATRRRILREAAGRFARLGFDQAITQQHCRTRWHRERHDLPVFRE